uniref:RNase H domain-containing protein n=1 Tax=Strongyloides venezuelensis TaxID=75913 RepID=A0A0K0EY16_STRVS
MHDLPKYNGRNFHWEDHTIDIMTDASSHGCGATCTAAGGTLMYTLRSAKFTHNVVNTTIAIHTDNTSAMSTILKYGTISSPELTELANKIWELALNQNLLLSIFHILEKMNTTNIHCPDPKKTTCGKLH